MTRNHEWEKKTARSQWQMGDQLEKGLLCRLEELGPGGEHDECLLRALYLRMQWSKEVVYLGTWYNLESPWKEVSVMNCLHWIDYGQACEGFSQLGRLSEKMNPECELHPCNGWALDCMRSAQNTVCMHRSLLTVGTIRPILSKLLSLQCPCHDGLGPGTVHWINSYCIKLALVRVFCHSNRDEAETQIERWQLL